MTCIKYRNLRFIGRSEALIAKMGTVLAEYDGQQLTVRQLYYQFVARDWIPNTMAMYKNFANLVTDARYAGRVSWDAIEDRGRVPVAVPDYESIDDCVDQATAGFRLPRWEGQANYVEVWVEKQALAGVLSPIISDYHVTLMTNKGYSSASAMKDSAERFLRRAAWAQRRPVLIYLGDHDPSGKDMVRDIGARLMEFGAGELDDLDVVNAALTMAQVKKHKPPPNPAKETDSRAPAYVREYGHDSWELDALPPRELTKLVRDTLEGLVDRPMMDAVVAKEGRDRATLGRAMELARQPHRLVELPDVVLVSREQTALRRAVAKVAKRAKTRIKRAAKLAAYRTKQRAAKLAAKHKARAARRAPERSQVT